MLERWRGPGAGSCLRSCQDGLSDRFNAITCDHLPQAVEGEGGGDNPCSLPQLAAKPGRCVGSSLCPSRWTTVRRSRGVRRQHVRFTARAPTLSDSLLGKVSTGQRQGWAATSQRNGCKISKCDVFRDRSNGVLQLPLLPARHHTHVSARRRAGLYYPLAGAGSSTPGRST